MFTLVMNCYKSDMEGISKILGTFQTKVMNSTSGSTSEIRY